MQVKRGSIFRSWRSLDESPLKRFYLFHLVFRHVIIFYNESNVWSALSEPIILALCLHYINALSTSLCSSLGIYDDDCIVSQIYSYFSWICLYIKRMRFVLFLLILILFFPQHFSMFAIAVYIIRRRTIKEYFAEVHSIKSLAYSIWCTKADFLFVSAMYWKIIAELGWSLAVPRLLFIFFYTFLHISLLCSFFQRDRF